MEGCVGSGGLDTGEKESASRKTLPVLADTGMRRQASGEDFEG